MSTARPAVLVALSALVLVGASAGPAVASPTPSPVCPVCVPSAVTADEADWSSPDERTLTVTAHGNGSATWVAELRWNDPGEAPDPDEETRLEDGAEAALETSYLSEAEAVAVDVREGGEATVRWRTPGVVDDRLGHGVVRLFHGEGRDLQLFVNVDELVVRAPSGRVVTNDPAVGTVTDDGTAVRVDGPERAVGDFYVVFGEERDAVSAVTTELAIGSLVWPVAAENLFAYLLFPTIAFALGLAGLYAVGRVRGVDPDRADRYGVSGLAGGVVMAVVYVAGPGAFDPPFFLPATFLAFGALTAFGAAVAGGTRRRVVATGLAVPAIALAPLVAGVWPAVRLPGLGLLVSILYTGLAVAVVVLGAPWFLYGMAVGKRRAAA